jgi:hypothetical protein
MRCSYASFLAIAIAGGIEGAVLHQEISRELGGNVIRAAASKTCLAANALQTASDLTGQEPGTAGIEAGQTPSAT